MTMSLFSLCYMLYYFTALQAIHEVTITATGILLKCIMTTNDRMFGKIKVSHFVTGLTRFLTEMGASTETEKRILWMVHLIH